MLWEVLGGFVFTYFDSSVISIQCCISFSCKVQWVIRRCPSGQAYSLILLVSVNSFFLLGILSAFYCCVSYIFLRWILCQFWTLHSVSSHYIICLLALSNRVSSLVLGLVDGGTIYRQAENMEGQTAGRIQVSLDCVKSEMPTEPSNTNLEQAVKYLTLKWTLDFVKSQYFILFSLFLEDFLCLF